MKIIPNCIKLLLKLIVDQSLVVVVVVAGTLKG